jgi:hypothetical protein
VLSEQSPEKTGNAFIAIGKGMPFNGFSKNEPM